jgi:PPM family protein phosphatase
VEPARIEPESHVPSPEPGVSVAAATDVGQKREQNEDNHGVWNPETAEERDRRGVLLVIADGMGGAVAGEVASRLAVETVTQYYGIANGDPPGDLRRAVEAANQTVHEKTRTEPSLQGMGTTCTAVALHGGYAWIAHVGDSRAYLLRGGQLHQLTRDHTLVAQLVEKQQLRPEQARTDSRRNVVTRSIGVAPRVEVDTFAIEVEPNDKLLLCTDGLHGLVTDTDLADTMNDRSLEQACQDLIALANDCGGPDNITVIIAQIEPIQVSTPGYSGPERRRPPRPVYPGPDRRSTSPSPYVGLDRRRERPVYTGPERRRAHLEPPPPGPAGHQQRLVLLVLLAAAMALAAWSAVWLVSSARKSSRTPNPETTAAPQR